MTRRSNPNHELAYPARIGALEQESCVIFQMGDEIGHFNAAMRHSFPRTRTALRVAFNPVGSLMAKRLMEPPSGRKPPSGFRRSTAQRFSHTASARLLGHFTSIGGHHGENYRFSAR
jgi:hypothetical protein